MPLLGKKLFSLLKPLNSVTKGESIYTIDHTGEQFKSKAEYEQRVRLYEDKVWTCQCSGHINLTYKEAYESEQDKYRILEQCFPNYLQKPVLSLVHHSTKSLDELVDESWRALQFSLAIGEKVQFKVKNKEDSIHGVITNIDYCTQNGDLLSNSPSSDKENHEIEAPASPKKWSHPKLLPHKYSLDIEGQDKIVNGVPSADLRRIVKPPSKDMVKLFIRGFATRHQSSSPWVVKEDLLKKYNIPNKYADFLVSPVKMMQLGRKTTEKRKGSQSKEPAAKRRKKDSTVSNKKPQQKGTPKKTNNGVNAKRLLMTLDSNEDSSDDDVALSVVKSNQNTPKKGTPKKSATAKDTPKSTAKKVSSVKGTPKKDTSAKSTPKKDGKCSQKKDVPKRKEKSLADLKKELKKSKSLADMKKNLNKNNKKPVKKQETKGKMKQMTLFDLKKKNSTASPKKAGNSAPGTPKKSGAKTPTKSPKKKTNTPLRQPPIVLRLLKAQKAENKHVYCQLLSKCAKEISDKQRQNLPPEIKEAVMKKHEAFRVKKMIEKMSDKEKEEYFKQKKEEHKLKIKKLMREKNRKFEDTDLPVKALPAPKLVPTPDGLANELFGDVVMVTQFIHSYQQLFCNDGDKIIDTESLMKALVSKDDCNYLLALMVLLLQTLLQDSLVEDCRELTVPLTSIPVTPYSALELLRLCLKHQDSNDQESNAGSVIEDNEVHSVSPVLVEALESTDMVDLEPSQRLCLLSGLCELLLGSYSIEDHLEQKQIQATDLWKKRNAGQKERNDQRKEEKQKIKEMKKQGIKLEPKMEEEKDESKKGLCITDFYGKQEADDLASVVKSRRLNASKAAAEKERRDEERKIQREKEYQEYKQIKDIENLEKQFLDGQTAMREAFRHAPLGTDRNHNRYWLFQTCAPGIYVENGWAPADINYCCMEKNKVTDQLATDNDTDDETTDDASGKETTFPHTGQNLWFVYDNSEDFSKLLKCLHTRGLRESSLIEELNKNDLAISKMFKKNSKDSSKDPKDNSDPSSDNNVIEGFREELNDTELRLRNGGLGGVKDFISWDNKLNEATTIQHFGDLLIETQSNVLTKFVKGMMAPKQVKKEAVDEGEEELTEVNPGLDLWLDAVRTCPTYSRLHLLLGIMDSGITWEKSAENAKCKICRKKGDEDRVILCDECNNAFHFYCLRPQILSLPKGDWFCIACAPPTKRRRTVTSYKDIEEPEASPEEEESSSDESSDEEITPGACVVCDGEEDTVICHMCADSFHLDCHEPALRYAPRNNQWRCQQCKTGVKIKKLKSGTRSSQSKRPSAKLQDSDDSETEIESEDDDSTEEEEDSSTEEEEEPVPPKKQQVASRRSKEAPRQRNSRPTEQEKRKVIYEPEIRKSSRPRLSNPKYMDESEDEEPVTKVPLRRSTGSSTRGAKISESQVIESVIDRLSKHRSGWPFIDPVDRDEVPDYYELVKNPIDFRTMMGKSKNNEYRSAQEFVDDMAMLLDNAEQYNEADSQVGRCVKPLEKTFREILRLQFSDCKYAREVATQTIYDDHAYICANIVYSPVKR